MNVCFTLLLWLGASQLCSVCVSENCMCIVEFCQLFCRTVGKSSSETRVYFSAPHLPLKFDSSSIISDAKENMDSDTTLNARACYLSGQDVHGNAILASIGYTWRSSDLFSENITLGAYHRYVFFVTFW